MHQLAPLRALLSVAARALYLSAITSRHARAAAAEHQDAAVGLRHAGKLLCFLETSKEDLRLGCCAEISLSLSVINGQVH